MTDERQSVNIQGASVWEVAAASSDTVFYNDADTSFSAEVPQPGCVAETVPDGNVNIKDSAVEALVFGSKDTIIDKRGAKTTIKIPDEDCPSDAQHSGPSSGSVLVNSVVDSSDTKISMEGARIKIKGKKRKKQQQPMKAAGLINLSNSAAVSVVAYSERTEIDMKDSEINIE